MRVLLISDLHVNAYCPISANYDTMVPYYEDFYGRYMTPADAICLAGDIANEAIQQAHFLRFLSTKYGKVYYVFGNHDLVVKGDFLNGPSGFSSSEKRIASIKELGRELDNLFVLDGDVSPDGLVGGTMGMCDFSYPLPKWPDFDPLTFWHEHWFDGRHWEYRGQDFGNILAYEMEKLGRVCEHKPKIIMTHFCPLQMGVSEKFSDDPVTSAYFFDAEKYLASLPDGTIWQCGHTHDQYDTEWGGVRIMCNPLGYPEEENHFGLCKGAGTYVVNV